MVLSLNIDEIPKGASSVFTVQSCILKRSLCLCDSYDSKPYKSFSLDDAGEHTLSIHLGNIRNTEAGLARPGFNDASRECLHLVYGVLPLKTFVAMARFSPDEPKKKVGGVWQNSIGVCCGT